MNSSLILHAVNEKEKGQSTLPQEPLINSNNFLRRAHLFIAVPAHLCENKLMHLEEKKHFIFVKWF